MQTPVIEKGVETTSEPIPAPPREKPELAVDLSRIAQDLQLRKLQIESVVQLLDEGNTVPFITRYRKERTGGLKEDAIRQIQARVQYQRQLLERKQTILKSIEGQGKLTPDLRSAILAAETSKRLEDLYLPYKPKKRTLATTARERGLEPLALAIWNRDQAVANLGEVLAGMVNPEKELPTVEDVLLGAQHILAELIAETADVRAGVRSALWETGKLVTAKAENLAEGHGLEYKDYFQFTEPARRIPPHRILAINRGEKEKAIKVQLECDPEVVRLAAFSRIPLADHPHAEFLQKVAEDALTRLLLPSLEREIRRELTDEAEDHAIKVFARNLRSLLMQPPIRGRRVLAIDPGFRTGCKVAALDEVGNLLQDTVIYPFTRPEKPRNRPADKPPQPAGQTTVAAPASSSPVPDATATPSDGLTPTPPAAEPLPTPIAVQANEPTPQASPSARATEPGPAPPVAEAPPSPTAPAPEAVPSASAVPDAPAPAPTVESAAPVAPPAPAAPPPREVAKAALEALIKQHNLTVIAVGNGTACRDTEELVSELITEKLPEMAYVIVNEAGASVYSTSQAGREEFPTFDATLRGTISIGRRLQDPLSELVKIDPQNNGVGLYQHDIHPRRLREALDTVVESCVNHVGVDLNTASVPLLRHVSGLNQLVARELVEYRKQNGPFTRRDQLLQVPNMGPTRFVQAAGFLKIRDGDNPLDRTWVHPESYPVTEQIFGQIGSTPQALLDKDRSNELREKINQLSPEELGQKLNVGVMTLRDIFEALARPGRDPREDLPQPVFKKGILRIEDLQTGMELKGTVLNVVDFGAFVDIGLKDSGLVHISQMANRYIRNPYDVVAVGDVVDVWVLGVDHERKRVSLTMIKPGSPRRPPEKRPTQEPAQQGAQPAGQPDQSRHSGPPAQPRGGRSPQGRRPPPHRRQDGGGPRRNQPPAPAPAQPGEAAPAHGTRADNRAPSAQAQPPQRPRRPRRDQPKPNLSQAALEGSAPLRTFGELKAFFEAQKKPETPPPPATPPAPEAPGASPPPPAP